jgi:hypothetical protein
MRKKQMEILEKKNVTYRILKWTVFYVFDKRELIDKR